MLATGPLIVNKSDQLNKMTTLGINHLRKVFHACLYPLANLPTECISISNNFANTNIIERSEERKNFGGLTKIRSKAMSQRLWEVFTGLDNFPFVF